MQTEIAGLKITYKNAQDLNQKVLEAKEQTDKDLIEINLTFKTLKKRATVLNKFLGGVNS